MEKLQVIAIKIEALKTTHIISPSENLVAVLEETFSANKISPKNGSVLVIAETLVAITQNRIFRLQDIKSISEKAQRLAEQYSMDARLVEEIIKEADAILGGLSGMLFTEKAGVLIANAGIDKSNSGGDDYYSYWPLDPYTAAYNVCNALKEKYQLEEFGVIISDSRVHPMRRGVIGVAIGVAGFFPTIDCRNKCDLFGNKMKFTVRALADQIADAAHIVMGECDEQTPFVYCSNVPVQFTSEKIDPKQMLMPKSEDLFFRILGNFDPL